MDWLPHLDLSALSHLLLETPVPTPKVPPDVESLKAQIDLLKATNAQITAEYLKKLDFVSKQGDDLNSSFKDYMNWALLVFGLLGGIFTFVFKQSLDDAREYAKKIVSQQVELRVTEIVGAELAKVQRLLDRERVVSNAALDYFLPDGQEPSEMQILRSRGFERIEFRTSTPPIRRGSADLVVVDLVNWRPDGSVLFKDLPEGDREDRAKTLLEAVIDVVADTTIVVVYVNAQVKSLSPFLRGLNPMTLANSRITLVGALADAAYVTRHAIAQVP
jgi:hypothetical protein